MIKATNLLFGYSEEREKALNGVNFTAEKGEFIAVLGSNGCGKSTLAKHFNAILLPEEGTVEVEGMLTTQDDRLFDIRQKVGMVFQNPDNQIVATIVEEDVAFALENMGVEPSEIRRRIDEAMEKTGVYKFKDKAPHHLSGGQKQRVAIARAIVNKPSIILADEPTGALDSKTAAEIMELFRELNKNRHTVIIVTHDLEIANQCDRIIEISDGKII